MSYIYMVTLKIVKVRGVQIGENLRQYIIWFTNEQTIYMHHTIYIYRFIYYTDC